MQHHILRCRSSVWTARVHPPQRRSPIDNPRVNDSIRISPVRLVAADGEQVGVVSLDAAKERAAEAQLDLVEVAANARPPVVRLMDWGKERYDRQKKAREARKNQHTVELKEIQLRPRTDDHDFEVKAKRARRFLEEGNAVRVVLRFRGRELRQAEVGIKALDRMLESLSDIGRVEQRSNTIEGRRLVALMEPA
ncbi:MAG: translation initiation factor IF-3 [Gemmatimonadota bacterium]